MTSKKALRKVRKVLKLIEATEGKIFSVRFIKRTTGEERKMRCRLGVTSHLKGGEKAFDDADYQLVTVFDLAKESYRSIPLDAVLSITFDGKTVNFEE
jgi:hypothetical protein